METGGARVSVWGKNWSKEEENEPRVRRGVFIGLQRRASSRIGALGSRQRERGGRARRRAALQLTVEMRTTSSDLLDEGVSGLGHADGLLVGCHGQMRSGKVFFPLFSFCFYFLFLYFQFSYFYLNLI
jgi:hypothetical protein